MIAQVGKSLEMLARGPNIQNEQESQSLVGVWLHV